MPTDGAKAAIAAAKALSAQREATVAAESGGTVAATSEGTAGASPVHTSEGADAASATPSTTAAPAATTTAAAPPATAPKPASGSVEANAREIEALLGRLGYPALVEQLKLILANQARQDKQLHRILGAFVAWGVPLPPDPELIAKIDALREEDGAQALLELMPLENQVVWLGRELVKRGELPSDELDQVIRQRLGLDDQSAPAAQPASSDELVVNSRAVIDQAIEVMTREYHAASPATRQTTSFTATLEEVVKNEVPGWLGQLTDDERKLAITEFRESLRPQP